MPVTTKAREDYRKLDDASRQAATNDQLKRIRVGSTGPGVMDHVEINDALDHIEALQKENPKAAKDAAQAGTAKPLGVPATTTDRKSVV